MKEIIAVIRPKKVNETKRALDQLGFPGMTAVPVLGRGKQKGLVGEINIEFRPGILENPKAGTMKYIPKRMLSVVVPDTAVEAVVNAIVRTNQTEQIGDGKIFICPLDNAVRVRTDEEGDSALL